MKKFIESDFSGGGQYIVRSKKDYIKDTGALSTITYKIGWFLTPIVNNNKYCLIAMSDGMIYQEVEDISRLVKNLNKHKEYRFATQEEIVRVVMYQKHRWRN